MSGSCSYSASLRRVAIPGVQECIHLQPSATVISPQAAAALIRIRASPGGLRQEKGPTAVKARYCVQMVRNPLQQLPIVFSNVKH